MLKFVNDFILAVAIDCPEDYVKCSNGQCIKKAMYCAGNARCYGGAHVADANCPVAECQSDQFACASFTKCVHQSNICDDRDDCGDSSDEQNCEERVCAEDEFRCNSGQCIKKLSYCTTEYSICYDFTNLSGACLDFACPPDGNYFQCQTDGRCISNSLRCDGYQNCADGSDETKCLTKECSEGYVKCSNGQCLNKTSYCSGEVWCWNNAHVVSDTDCPPAECESNQFACAKLTYCINKFDVCDNHNHCIDGSDEQNCEDRVCADDEFRCNSGQCIDKLSHCSMNRFCNDGSNLTGACHEIQCEEDEVRCASGECLSEYEFCTEFHVCRDGSLRPENEPRCDFAKGWKMEQSFY